jgi:beta-glucosidase-like glycosyl hydrolase
MLLIGVAGTELTAQERDWLQHDAVAGVVLFKRNFASRQQVTDLTRRSAPPPAPAADLRGPGRRRVQRFREGYSALPPLQDIGALYAPTAAGAGAGRAARLADGQRSARQRRGPELRAGGRSRPRQPRHRQPRLQ